MQHEIPTHVVDVFVLSIDRDNRPSSKFEKATINNPIPQHGSEVPLHPEITRGNGNPKPPNFGPYCSHMIYVRPDFGGLEVPQKSSYYKEAHTVQKRYLALCTGRVADAQGWNQSSVACGLCEGTKWRCLKKQR